MKNTIYAIPTTNNKMLDVNTLKSVIAIETKNGKPKPVARIKEINTQSVLIGSVLRKLRNTNNKAIKHTKPIYEKFLTYKKMIENAVQDEKVLDSNSDADLIELAKMELDDIKAQIPSIESELKIMLIPRDPNNDKNVIVEMRPGVGGG